MMNLIEISDIFYKLAQEYPVYDAKIIKKRFLSFIQTLDSFDIALMSILKKRNILSKDLHDFNLNYKSILSVIVMILKWLLDSFYFNNASQSLNSVDPIKDNYVMFTKQKISRERLIKIAETIIKLSNQLKSEIKDLPILAEKIEKEEGDMIRYFKEVHEIFEKIVMYIKDVMAILGINIKFSVDLDHDLENLSSLYSGRDENLEQKEIDELMEGYNFE